MTYLLVLQPSTFWYSPVVKTTTVIVHTYMFHVQFPFCSHFNNHVHVHMHIDFPFPFNFHVDIRVHVHFHVHFSVQGVYVVYRLLLNFWRNSHYRDNHIHAAESVNQISPKNWYQP
jgi:hypothetical protein